MTDNTKPFGRDPDPLTATEWLIVLSCTTGALSIIGGLIYLCLVLIRG
jgi:hypothetical protein